MFGEFARKALETLCQENVGTVQWLKGHSQRPLCHTFRPPSDPSHRLPGDLRGKV